VNSFGFGGTNAHVLLEEVSDQQNSVSSNKVHEIFFLPLSARSESALRDLALKYYQFLQDETIHLADLLYSASMKRSHLSHRLAIVAENKEDLCKGLNNFYQKIPTVGVCYNQALEHTQPKIVFVYSGMGPQWQGMGQALFKSFPEFEKSLRKCDVIFKKIAGWSILNELMQKEKGRMQESAVAQPANFIIQMALTEFLMTRGIIPSAVVGHSIGEVAAAYISGALSLKDAITISYHRSRLQQTRSGKGTMLAVGLSHKNVQRFLSDYLQIDVAAINSPNAVTLAGDKNQLEQLSAKLSTDGIFNRFLQVDIAYHSQQMNVLEAELKKSLKHIRAQINTIPFYSTVEGREIHGKNLTANYWWQNVRQPVLFFNTCIDLIKAGYRHFVEIGPHPVLSNSIKECLHEMDVYGFTTPTLNRNTPEVKTFVEAIGHLYTQGCKLDWKHVVDTNARYIKLPHYQWQNQHYSRETAVSRENRLGCEGHIFFNTNLYMPHPAWQVELNDQFFPYLNDHKIQKHIVFPGASYVEAGLALHAKLFNESVYRLEDLQFHRLLTVHTDQIQLLTLEFNAKTKNYSVASCIKEDNLEWQTHATGTMVSNAVGTADVIDMDILRKECHLLVNVEDFYHKLKKHALDYGPMFQVVDKLMLGNNSLMAHLITEKKSDETIEFLYPPLLDGAFQALVMHIIGQKTTTTNTYVPVAIKTINYYQNPGRECWCYAVITKYNSKVIEGDILLLDENGNILVELREVRCQSIDTFSESANVPNHLFYKLKWESIAPISREITSYSNKRCLLISTSENKGIELCEILNAKSSSHYEFLTTADYYKKELKPENLGHIIFLYSFFSEIHPELITPDILIHHLNLVISLVKKINENVESRQKFVIDIITEDAQQILADDNCQNLLAASLWNLGLLFENENPNVSCRLIDIDKYTPFDSIVADLMSLPNEKYVGFRNQQRFSKKLDLDSTFNTSETSPLGELNVNQHAVELTILPTGGANNIIYSEIERKVPNENEVEVRVYAAPLNFKDLLKIHHQISDNVIENTYFGDTIGMEMIGKVIRTGENVIDIKIGDTVVALAGNSFRSYATIPSAYVTKIPHSLSVNSCSYIVYMTAYRCLIDIAVLTEGEKVLIHNATGGVGLAAIQIAKWKKAEIYATAGTEKKRNYLRSIGIKYVYDSRSLRFFDEILRDTNNYGVDVVLNAIAGDALNKSFELLAPYGRFVEIGKRDISQNNGLSMRAFNRNLLFAAVDIDRLAAERPLLTRELINHVTDCFEKNIFSPIPHAVFNASQTSEAFRFMGQNQHIGKVVITFDDNVTVCAKSIAESKELIKSQHTYLITGGTSGVGLAVAEWLVHQGATHLVLLSRRGAHSIEAQHRIAALQQKNTTVIIASIDISNSEQIKSVFKNVLSTLPPLKGIIHSAMVLDDGCLVDMTPERFIKVLQPKMAGALNLHQLTKHLSLDFFVMFSSISSLVGNPGQANYVLANGFLDAFAHYRSVQGLAATAINWGREHYQFLAPFFTMNLLIPGKNFIKSSII
jgi:acyl transferase domain-containing protein